MKNWICIFISFLTFLIACSKDELPHGTVTDIDGNTYKTVVIGGQEWMAENLRTTKYRNGVAIPNVGLNSEWNQLTSGASCVYKRDLISPVDVKIYGRLYNFFAVSDANQIAPEGWHIPTEADWQKLLDFYGGEFAAGPELKKTDKFNFIFGGRRLEDFVRIDDAGYYWSSTTDIVLHNATSFTSGGNRAYLSDSSKNNGLSVRCVKD